MRYKTIVLALLLTLILTQPAAAEELTCMEALQMFSESSSRYNEIAEQDIGVGNYHYDSLLRAINEVMEDLAERLESCDLEQAWLHLLKEEIK
jgi:hypothetical protein